jgi:hypothetical protein
VCFTARSLIQIDDRHWYVGPAKVSAGLKPPLPGNEPPLGGDHDRMKQADLRDAVGESTEIAQLLPVPKPDLDLVNVHLL